MSQWVLRTRRGSARAIERLARPRRVNSEAAALARARRGSLSELRAGLIAGRAGAASALSQHELIEVVCVSNRVEKLACVVETFQRQSWPQRRLHLQITADRIPEDLDQIVSRGPAPVVTTLRGSSWTIGRSLNSVLDTAQSPFVAKIDDDDHYGPHYLSDLMDVAVGVGCGVVGKHAYFGYLEAADDTILRFPRGSYSFTPFLAGGSLLINQSRIRRQRFSDVSLAEDQRFLMACNARGVSTFSADPFNFVQTRHARNTWAMTDELYAADSEYIGAGLRLDVAFC